MPVTEISRESNFKVEDRQLQKREESQKVKEEPKKEDEAPKNQENYIATA